MMKEKIVPALYILYGLADIIIPALLNSILIHMVILGVICLAAGTGLGMKKAWSIYPVVFTGLLTPTVGVATLYSSIAFAGLGPTPEVLMFNLFLIVYGLASVGLSVYIIAKKSIIFNSC